MKVPLEIFTLTKREQRVVIVIVMALLAGAIAKHYRDARLRPASAASTSAHEALSSSPSPAEEDQASPDETP